MKLNKLKENKMDFENCLATLPEPSELSVSKIRDGASYWSYECSKGGFLYLLGEDELNGEDKADYYVKGFVIKENDIKKEQSSASSELSVSPDGDAYVMVYVEQSYREGEKWNKKDILDMIKLELEYKIGAFNKRIEKALEQKNKKNIDFERR